MNPEVGTDGLRRTSLGRTSHTDEQFQKMVVDINCEDCHILCRASDVFTKTQFLVYPILASEMLPISYRIIIRT